VTIVDDDDGGMLMFELPTKEVSIFCFTCIAQWIRSILVVAIIPYIDDDGGMLMFELPTKEVSIFGSRALHNGSVICS